MKISILADQFGNRVGGGRFTTNFVNFLIKDQDMLSRIENLNILATQNEAIRLPKPLPDNVRILNRRFPSRLRNTTIAYLFGYLLPKVDISYGPFFYNFPSNAKNHVITVHDLSFLYEEYHPKKQREKFINSFLSVIRRSSAVVCISKFTLAEFNHYFPNYRGKTKYIYNGVSNLLVSDLEDKMRFNKISSSPFILTVGTIEPRKNYDTILRAYEVWLSEEGLDIPNLIIVGPKGWMSEKIINEMQIQRSPQKVFWIPDATDSELAMFYKQCSVFSYLSLYEGFGYPPFEAALARKPMVLSDRSSIFEIWSGYAKCVNPLNIRNIIDGWKWAFELKEEEFLEVTDQQYRLAKQLSWDRSIKSYLEFFESI